MTPLTVFKKELPEVFWASDLDVLTYGIISWRSIKNISTPKYSGSKTPPPSFCFSRVGRRVVINRDPFLNWWESQFLNQSSAI